MCLRTCFKRMIFAALLASVVQDLNAQQSPSETVASSRPQPYTLTLREPPRPLPIEFVDAYPKDPPDKFGNDLVILGDAVPDHASAPKSGLVDKAGRRVFQVTGSHEYAIDPVALALAVGERRSAKMESTAGLPGTRLNVSKLKKPMPFMGKCWLPKAGGESFILVTKERVIGVRVTVTDASPTNGTVTPATACETP